MGTYASEIETALKDLDFTGKIIRVITTNERSGLENVVSDVQGANVLDDALAIRGFSVKNSRNIVEDWI